MASTSQASKAPVKSILLPTVPVSPVRPRVVRTYGRRRTSLLNIPSINMPPKFDSDSPATASKDGMMTRSVPLRTEEEQAAAARARQRKEVLASRAERRKSLGNRRVSFAAEATLHTFAADDFPTTPSSAGAPSRDSTPGSSGGRRRGGAQTPKKKVDSSSSEDENEAFSSSPIAPDGLGRLVGPGETGGAGDSNSSTSGSDSGSDGEDTLGSKKSLKGKGLTPYPDMAPMDFDEDEEMLTDLVKDKDEDITLSAKGMMKNFFKKPIRVIHGDTTQPGLPSQKQQKSVGASQPPKPRDEDDEEDMAMDITRPIGGMLSKAPVSASPEPTTGEHEDGEADMDITRPVGGLLARQQHKPPIAAAEEDDDDDGGDMTMDITRPIGGLISSMRGAAKQLQKHLKPSVMFGGASRGEAADDDDTMEMTKPIGGLIPQQDDVVQYPQLGSTVEDDAEGDGMDMDMTRPIGGLKRVIDYPSLPTTFDDGDQTMDMTRPVGRILKGKNQERAHIAAYEQEDEQTMDLTVAVGSIKSGSRGSTNEHGEMSLLEDDESMDEGETMDFTAVVGSEILNRGGKGRRGSAIGAVVLMSGKNWEKEQEAERQAQKDMEATEHGTEGISDKTAAGKEKDKGLDEDGDIDMDFDEDAAMEFTAIIPSSIQQLQTGAVKELLAKGPTPKKTPPKTGTSPSQAVTRASNALATPVNIFYGNNKKKPGSAFFSPGGEWISPLRPSKYGKGGSASKDNSPAEGATVQAIKAAKLEASKATQESPIQPKKQESEAPAQTQKRTTRSSLGRGRASLVAEESAPAPAPARVTRSAKKSEDTSDTPVAPSSTPTSTRPAVMFETPTRPEVSKDGFTHSARRRVGGTSDPSTPDTNRQRRRLSGIGIDKPGLGSPAIVASLSKRRSIGENSPFRLGTMAPREILFESLRIAAEEKEEEQRKSDEAFAEEKRRLEKAKDETVDLKLRIESMTPRKAAMERPVDKRKRKSDQVENGGGDGVRRDLFGEVIGEEKREAKRRSLRLDKSLGLEPEKDEPKQTGGRRTRSRASLENAAVIEQYSAKGKKAIVISPTKRSLPPSAQQQEERKEEKEKEDEEEADEEIPRIAMQEFLNMTGISFLDNITHTKRRQTMAGGARKTLASGPSALFKKKKKNGSAPEPPAPVIHDDDEDQEPSLGDWIVAGAATTAVYSLFWSSCHELKKDIAEGKIQMKIIERGVNAQNPKLFQEYMDAPVDLKLIMDSQFKSIKTHCRLLAKRDWYNWRTKQLLDLNRQLSDNLHGLREDEEVIRKQGEMIDGVLPGAIKTRGELKRRLEKLVERRREVESCDPGELTDARKRLVELREEVERKRQERDERKKEAEGMERVIEERKKRMEWLRGEIEKAEKVREMNRGFGEEEVWTLRKEVKRLEQKYGWSIVSVEKGSQLSMAYRGVLLLVLHIASSGKKLPQSPEVKYIGPRQESNSNTQYPLVKPTTTTPPLIEQAYLLGILQEKLSSMAGSTPPELVRFVSRFWDAASMIVAQIAKVRGRWITTCSYPPPSSASNEPDPLLVSVKVVLPAHKARVGVFFKIDGGILLVDEGDDEERFANMVEVSARVIYNHGTKKVTEAALRGDLKGSMLGVSVMGMAGGWEDAVEDVVGRCFVGEGTQGRRKKPLQEQQLNEQPAAGGEGRVTRSTPKRAARGEKTPAKKIPVRKPVTVEKEKEVEEVREEKVAPAPAPPPVMHLTRAASKQSSIPLPAAERKLGGLGLGSAVGEKEKEKEKDSRAPVYDGLSNPFGTGKRGIPVPTKPGAGEDH